MKNFIILLSALTISIASIAQNQIQGASISKFEATQMSNNGQMFIVPLVSELHVNSTTPKGYSLTQKIILPDMRDRESQEYYLTRVENYINAKIEELKAQSLFEFIDNEKASLIISPIYSVKTIASHDKEMTIEVRIKGFPATYCNFRNMQPDDAQLLDLDKRIVNHKLENVSIKDRKIHTDERTESIVRN